MMKRALMFAAVAAAANAWAVTLTPQNAEIVTGAEACGVVTFAAKEMAEFLGKSFGAPVKVVEAPTAGKVSIILGSNDWSRAAGIDTAALGQDEFVIKAGDGKVFIAGKDEPGSEATLKGKHPRATLFGTYEFLYRYVGVRMYFPGELGTIVPKAAEISVPEGTVKVKPSYIVRRYGPKDGTVPKAALEAAGIKDDEEFKRINRLRQRLETERIPCCHGQLYSRFYKRFAKTHPEYFVMGKDGKRHPTEAVVKPLFNKEHVCHSSGIWEEIYQDAKAYLTDQPPEVRKIPNANGTGYTRGPGVGGKYYDIMPHDGGGECYCPACQARYDHSKKNYATELLWSNTVAVARRLKAEGVKGYVTQMAYHPYADVPSMDIPDNVLVMVAQSGPWRKAKNAGEDVDELVKAWAKKTGGKVWLWTYPDKIFERRCPDIPQMSPHAWGGYFKRLSDWIIGGFGESESDRWIYNYLNYYVFSRVCWDVNADVDAILDEHYRLMFGAAAGKVKAFFESLERKWVDEVVNNTTIGPEGPVTIVPGYYEMWAKVYSPELLAGYAKLLDEAAAAVAPGSLEARRIAMIRGDMLDPLVAAAKDAHDSFNVERSLAKRKARATGTVVYEDVGGDLGKWTVWPKSKMAKPVRAAEKGPLTGAPMQIAANNENVLKVWRNVTLKPGAKYRLSYFMRLDDLKVSSKWGRFSCRLKFEGAPRVGRDAPRFVGTTGWIYVEREYEIPKDFKKGAGTIDCTFADAAGRALVDGLRLEEIGD